MFGLRWATNIPDNAHQKPNSMPKLWTQVLLPAKYQSYQTVPPCSSQLSFTEPSISCWTEYLSHLLFLPSEGHCMNDHNCCCVPLQWPWTISPLISWGTHPPLPTPPPTKNIMLSFLYPDLRGQAKTPESLPMITNLLMLKDGLIKRFTYKTKLMC